MEHEVYFIDTGHSRVYFSVVDGVVSCCGKATAVSYDDFIKFIHTAQELGLRAGKI